MAEKLLKVGTKAPDMTAMGLKQTGSGELIVYNVSDGPVSLIGNVQEPYDEGYRGPIANFGLREYANFAVKDSNPSKLESITMSKDKIYVCQGTQAWIYSITGRLLWHRKTSDLAYDDVEFDDYQYSGFAAFKEINGIAYLVTTHHMYKISIETGEVVPFSESLQRVTLDMPGRYFGNSNSTGDAMINIFSDNIIVRTEGIECYDLSGQLIWSTDIGGKLDNDAEIKGMAYDGEDMIMVGIGHSTFYAIDISDGSQMGNDLNTGEIAYTLMFRDDMFVCLCNKNTVYSIQPSNVTSGSNFTNDSSFKNDLFIGRARGVVNDGKAVITSENNNTYIVDEFGSPVEVELSNSLLNGIGASYLHRRISVNKYGQFVITFRNNVFVLSTGLFIKNYGVIS